MAKYMSYFASANETRYFCIRMLQMTENSFFYQDICSLLEETMYHKLFAGCIADSLQNLTQLLLKNPKCLYEGAELYTRETGIAIIVAFSLVFLLGFPGNAMVLIVLGAKKIKKKSEVLIMSLAVADLVPSILGPFTYLAFYLRPYTGWKVPDSIEIASGIINTSALLVSAWSLVLIAMERHRIITKPLERTYSKAVKVTAILGTWLFSFAVSAPMVLAGWQIVRMDIASMSLYLNVWTFIGYITPLVIICILYGRCIRALRAQNLKALGDDAMKKRQIENKRVIAMLIMIVGLFFVLTLPALSFQAILSVVLAKMSSMEWDTYWELQLVKECLSIPLTLNSCINPIVYAKMHEDVRAFVKRSWQKISCRNKPKQGRSTSGVSNGGLTEDTAM